MAIDEFARSNSNLSNPDNSREHAYGTFTYDAVYAMAYALQGAEEDLQMYNLSLSDFEYADNITIENSTISEVIFKHLNETDFLGVSVSVLIKLNNSDSAVYCTQVNFHCLSYSTKQCEIIA